MAELSVLMSVYNTPISFLRESIESICNQTFKNYEFIIVDDGSSDINVKQLLEEYAKADSRIQIVKNEINIGLTKSLNKGLKICSGKYIARMDADDISLPKRFEIQYKYLENHPEIDILGSNVSPFGQRRKHVILYENYVKDEEKFRIKMLFDNVGPMHPSVMIRKSFLLKNKIWYRNEIKKAQDYALWIDCLNMNGKFQCTSDILLKYRIHENQITIKNSGEQYKYKQRIIFDQLTKCIKLDGEKAMILTTLYSNKYEYTKKQYINALNSLKRSNSIYNYFDSSILGLELKVRWIHKVIKCALIGRDFSGFICIYTYRCIFSKAIIIWVKEVLQKMFN